MFELWIPITVVAAFMQNARSVFQKHLKGNLTNLGAAYVRFLYAWPLALAYVAALNLWVGKALPEPGTVFFLYAVLGGICQIAFTALLMWLFSFRNFAVGTTFSKTEVVQIAILGFLILGDTVTLWAAVAIAISAAGVIALAAGQTRITFRTMLAGLGDKPTLIGLASGACLGGSVVFFRGAALSLDYDGGVAMAAGYTYAVSVVLQTVGMGLYLAWAERPTLSDVVVHWRWSAAAGVAGALASIAWFTAFTLENAAYVRAVGQIELVFTFAASIFFFRERTSRLEVLGIAGVIGGILILLLMR